MRILVAWDSSDQADLMSLYLGAESNEVKICLTPEEFSAEFVQGKWDPTMMLLDKFDDVRNVATHLPYVAGF